ncbi:FKBP-type peptidyl-prolyl cis-trans isomerase [Ectothiorhodospira mobilis]|uniref:FKBP-type peptidyl-prolyl cis-trans isomerase n=1 Tax=Ectothiorhodospira mobilis TaxID=195064 RepID=UPI0030B84205
MRSRRLRALAGTVLSVGAAGGVSLLLVLLALRSCGMTPGQMQDEILLREMNIEAGEAYRAARADDPGVVTLDNGLQVEMLARGDGPVPGPEDRVRVHYEGRHLDGRVFDSSRERGAPAVIAVKDTIPGWRQALTSMPEGSRARLVVPPQLAYGEGRAGPSIGPAETLLFEVELLEVLDGSGDGE